MEHIVIGSFVFSVGKATPLSSFDRISEGAFSPVDLVGNATSEKTGRGLDSITLSAKWLRDKAQDDVAALRELIETVQQVSDGKGRNLGKWTIQRLNEKRSQFVNHGQSMVTDVTINLLEYRG